MQARRDLIFSCPVIGMDFIEISGRGTCFWQTFPYGCDPISCDKKRRQRWV